MHKFRLLGPKERKKTRGKIAMLFTIPFKFANGKCKELEFLVDTGSEKNLIKKEVVPGECLERASKKFKFLQLVVKL